jgi:hypothetical protein
MLRRAGVYVSISGARWTGGTLIAPVLMIGAEAACDRSWRADTLTPPITLGATLDARTSLPAVILVRDMEMPQSLWLPETAYFVAVSRDRLRFHVTLHHKWEEMSDPQSWQVWIEADRGRHFAPTACDRHTTSPVTRMYDRAALDPLVAVTVYRGQGDYVFYRHDLLRRDLRWLMLVMRRPGYEYRYRWSFVEATAQVGCRKEVSRCPAIAALP